MTKVLIAEVFPPILVERLRTMLPAGVELDMVASSSDDDFARAAADADILLCARRQVDRQALSPETHHLIGEAELAQMPAGAQLVNTSRGQVVDEAALRGAIENGHLGGVAIDVLEDELGEVNPFADLPQVLVTPHIAGTSQKSLPRAMQMAVANIGRFLHGEQLENPVPGTSLAT